jgi:hypothetical protein
VGVVHIFFLIGFRNRLAVFLNWVAETAPRPATRASAPRSRSALALPFPVGRAAPGEAVVATRLLSADDDVMPQPVANHAI